MQFHQEAAWQSQFPPEKSLVPGCVHIWELTPSPMYAEGLTAEESVRHQKMTDGEIRDCYATTQEGLRRVAAHYLHCAPGAVRIERGHRGKPYIEGGPGFNVSHTAGRILMAFSSGDIGVDVESESRRVRALELAEKFFTVAEARFLHGLPEDDRRLAFLRFWVCKEATVKLSGDGIYLGLRDAEIEFDAAGVPKGRYRGRDVHLRLFHAGGGLIAALATWHPVDVKCFVRIEKLLNSPDHVV